MQRVRTTIFDFIGLCVGMLSSIVAAQETVAKPGPSLKDTLQFIALKIESCQPPFEMERGYLFQEHYEFRYDDAGVITLRERIDTNDPRSGRSRYTFVFSLAELEPEVSAGRPKMIELTMHCAKRKCISVQDESTSPDGKTRHPLGDKFSSSSVDLRFCDVATRDRVLHAFSNAILKAGGKHSDF